MTIHDDVGQMVRALGDNRSEVPADAVAFSDDELAVVAAGLTGACGGAGELALSLLQRWEALATEERVAAMLVIANALAGASDAAADT